jgi:protein TonB
MAGFFITGTLFWSLWSLTDHTFDVVDVQTVKIDFTRQVLENPPEKKPREKPELMEPEKLIVDLPPIGLQTTGVDRTMSWTPPTVVTQPEPGGMKFGTDSIAAPLVRVNPSYPPREAQRGIEGWVIVQYDITPSGSIANVVAVETVPAGSGFAKAATDAVARWRYSPSVVNGQAVERVGVQTIIRFNLEGAE